MTQPNDLPPLPAPDIESTQCRESTMRVDYITSHSSTQMTAYGLQCAEAAVAKDREQTIAAIHLYAARQRTWGTPLDMQAIRDMCIDHVIEQIQGFWRRP